MPARPRPGWAQAGRGRARASASLVALDAAGHDDKQAAGRALHVPVARASELSVR